jgi:hypothetical protein
MSTFSGPIVVLCQHTVSWQHLTRTSHPFTQCTNFLTAVTDERTLPPINTVNGLFQWICSLEPQLHGQNALRCDFPPGGAALSAIARDEQRVVVAKSPAEAGQLPGIRLQTAI